MLLKVRRTVLATLLLLCTAVRAEAPATPFSFRLGVAPHTSARVILEMYQPLRAHLEAALGTPVEVVTAPDFTEFARRMLKQEYDLAITTGHQAQLGRTDGNYLPLLTYQAEFRAVALVAGNSRYKNAHDLQGQPVLGLSPSSIVTLWGQRWLKQNGNNDTLHYVSASDSVARLVLSGEAAAGFISLANYQSLARDVQSQMRFLVISPPLAGRIYLLNARDAGRREQIDNALWSFAASPAGKAYFEKYKLEGYRKIKPNELDAMEPFARAVKAALQ